MNKFRQPRHIIYLSQGLSSIAVTLQSSPLGLAAQTNKKHALQIERIEHDKTKVALAESEKLTQKIIREKEDAIHRQEVLEKEKTTQQTEIQKLKQIESEAKAKDERTCARIDRIASNIAKAAFFASALFFASIGIMAFFGNSSILFVIPAAFVGFFNLWCGFSGITIELYVKMSTATERDALVLDFRLGV